jgi:hypothetical protein
MRDQGDLVHQGMRTSRQSIFHYLLWLVIGLLLGTGIGLFLGWVAWPIEITEADPSVLESSYQREYALMIASAYSLDSDLTAARRHLALLGKDNIESWLLEVTVEQVLNRREEPGTRHLVMLAKDLELYSPVMEPYLTPNASQGSS